MWELDHQEGWAPKNWGVRIVVLEKTLESPLDSKEIKPVNPKGNQSWIFIGRADAEAPIHWPPDVKSLLIGKDLGAGKDWGQERRGQQRMRWLNGVTESMDMSMSKLWEMVQDREAWHASVHGVTNSQTWLSNWTTTIKPQLSGKLLGGSPPASPVVPFCALEPTDAFFSNNQLNSQYFIQNESACTTLASEFSTFSKLCPWCRKCSS